MAFANFYVSEGEITKQFKGCYRNSGNAPAAGDRGTIKGSWQPSPIPNIKPVPHSSIEGLYIYPGQTGQWTKMVGIQYGGPQGPQRVDGRAFTPTIKSLDSETVTQAWENAQDKGISNSDYGLTVKNVTPKKTVDECMKEASQGGATVFSVSNLASNNLAQCLAGNQVDDNPNNLIQNYPDPFVEFIEELEGEQPQIGPVDEQSCLKRKDANTVYNVTRDGPNPDILGNTYLGKSTKEIIGPGQNVRGTIQGSWQPSAIPNIKPVKHLKIKGLFIFAGQTGDWTKMVGMQYGDPNGPVRVDGKAFQPPVKSINSKSVTAAWENAQDNGIDSAAYGLSITNGGDDRFSYAESWELSQYPDSMLKLGTDYKEMKNYYATIEDAEYDLNGGDFSRVYKTPEECKQICVNSGDDCAGFIYDTEQNYCSLKNKMYPNVSGKSMDNEDSYIRLPVLNIDSNSGCPVGVKAVSSKFLTENGVFSSDPVEQMPDCSDFQQEENAEIKKISQLDQEASGLNKELSSLQKENQQIFKGFQETQKRFNDQVGSYDKLTKNLKIESMTNNPTAVQMIKDMNNLSQSFSMRNTGIMMVLVLLAIVSLRIFKR